MRRCDYRFDIERVLEQGRKARVYTAQETTADGWLRSELLPLARSAAFQAYAQESLLAQDAASFCYAVQYLARLELFPHKQASIAAEFVKTLKG
jgi:hypothetical protein